ncbi:MAG: hypothetical protein K2Q22_11765 [Cytophagales bacterium]|nr:hypothetical protein [Cytophagales bacterium]
MEASNLLLNIIPFDIPIKEIKCSFFEKPKDGCYPIRNIKFSNKVKAILEEGQTYFTDFQVHPTSDLTEIIDLSQSKQFSRQYCKCLIFEYFKRCGYIVRFNNLNEPEVWIKAEVQSNDRFDLYNKISIRVQNNRITKGFELLIYYRGSLPISIRSMGEMEGISTSLYNLVLFQKGIYKYNQLPDDAIYCQNEVFPHINKKVAKALNLEKTNWKDNRYLKIYEILSSFYDHHMNVPSFKKIIPIKDNGFYKIEPQRILGISCSNNFLLFGRNCKGTNPKVDLPQFGPYKLPKEPNKNAIHIFLILHEERMDNGIEFTKYILGEKEGCKGLKEYIKVPFVIEKEFSISFKNADNPFPEIKAKIKGTPWKSNITYFALYLSPISKGDNDPERHKVYFKVKEILLKFQIASQVIDFEKVDTENYQKNMANISVAILAKLKGVPWRLDRKVKDELIVGIGAFKSNEIGVRFLDCAFSFTNDGTFNEFGCYSESESHLLTGHIEKSIKNYKQEKGEVDRVIIHYYKTNNRTEKKFMDEIIHNLGLSIPIFVVSINKTEFEDYLVYDTNFKDLMPYSGTIIDIGRNEYVLCNNTRYPGQEDTQIESNQLPLKLSLFATYPKLLTKELIQELIDQVYEFSHMNWKSLKHQRLPVTVTYPEMVAQMLPYFDKRYLPPFGQKSLWFL